MCPCHYLSQMKQSLITDALEYDFIIEPLKNLPLHILLTLKNIIIYPIKNKRTRATACKCKKEIFNEVRHQFTVS